MNRFTIQTHDKIVGGAEYKEKIEAFLKEQVPGVVISDENPECVIILGGDGTIIDAVKKFEKHDPLFMGLNLGDVGFLASVRDKEMFLEGVQNVIEGKHKESKRMTIQGEVMRDGKVVAEVHAFNEIIVQSILGVVSLKVSLDDEPFQNIKGTGVMVSTPSGSTAYNLSAGGPIVSPTLECFIVTEMLDHNVKTPSVVLDKNDVIKITVGDFRKSMQELNLAGSDEPVDVVLSSDGGVDFTLQTSDEIKITKREQLVRLVELDKDYFFSSLREKFLFD